VINNALKFTKTGAIDFGYQRKEKMIEFYVKDTGIGIAPENQEIIFERFRQVDMADARNYEGAGLGLAISKAFVEKLGGKIWVQSELEKGATFFFNIPYNPKIKIKLEKPLEVGNEAKLPGINILIVEDDNVCMELLKFVLEEEKANLFFASDGQEAFYLVKTTPELQIVLMDLKMPVMNGFEATKLIKKLKPDLPVIAQSAYAFSNDQDKAKMAGCDDFISKPIVRELLLAKINKQLAKRG
jgi:CheY-like chemotaxis protein